MRVAFLQAASFPLRGLRYLVQHRELWPYALGAFLANLAVFAALFAFYSLFLPDLLERLNPDGAPGWLRPAIGCVMTLVLFLMAMVVYTALGHVVAGPFLEAMTERMFRMRGRSVPPSRGFWRSLGRSAINQAWKLVLFGGLQIMLLALLVTPAALVYPGLSGALNVLFLALEYLDYPLEIRRVPVPGRFLWLIAKAEPALGFGAVLFAAYLVPCVGYLLLPAWVCGAVLLEQELNEIN
ncbi:MAG: EI24 domain-containing protein [Planctomycetes bacterium]|nr:EI24 domain-containing protein [Planctomycetota bacterium]